MSFLNYRLTGIFSLLSEVWLWSSGWYSSRRESHRDATECMVAGVECRLTDRVGIIKLVLLLIGVFADSLRMCWKCVALLLGVRKYLYLFVSEVLRQMIVSDLSSIIMGERSSVSESFQNGFWDESKTGETACMLALTPGHVEPLDRRMRISLS